MKTNINIKSFIISISIVSFLLVIPTRLIFAEVFQRDLSFGLQNDADVITLQKFLTGQGVYSGPVNGNFFALTLQGVKDFQMREKILPAAGYFGAKTRARANSVLSGAVKVSAGQPTVKTDTISPATSPKTGTDAIKLLSDQITVLQQQLASALQSAASKKAPQQASTSPATVAETKNIHTPAIEAIDAFLADPTTINLRDFCNLAKQLPGIGTHDGLDEKKTSVIQVQNSFYESFPSPCNAVDDSRGLPATKKRPFTWFAFSNSFLLPQPANEGDIEEVQIQKIKFVEAYNKKLKSLEGYKIIRFDCYTCDLVGKDADSFQNVSPDDRARMLLKRTVKTSFSYGKLTIGELAFIDSFVSVEKELAELKRELNALPETNPSAGAPTTSSSGRGGGCCVPPASSGSRPTPAT